MMINLFRVLASFRFLKWEDLFLACVYVKAFDGRIIVLGCWFIIKKIFITKAVLQKCVFRIIFIPVYKIRLKWYFLGLKERYWELDQIIVSHIRREEGTGRVMGLYHSILLFKKTSITNQLLMKLSVLFMSRGCS